MPITAFPDPRTSDEDGLLALGGDLQPESLLLAYRKGIFPWPIEGLPLPWFSPPHRAILDFQDLHIPRSLRKSLVRAPYALSLDRDFRGVITKCAELRQGETWITPEMLEAYVALHKLGHAHSAEAWKGDELVGGIYGVSVDGCFAGESMFRLKPDASKHAFLHLVEHLRSRGLDWIDIQQLTPHMERFGAKEIPREEFLARLARTQDRKLRLFD